MVVAFAQILEPQENFSLTKIGPTTTTSSHSFLPQASGLPGASSRNGPKCHDLRPRPRRKDEERRDHAAADAAAPDDAAEGLSILSAAARTGDEPSDDAILSVAADDGPAVLDVDCHSESATAAHAVDDGPW